MKKYTDAIISIFTRFDVHTCSHTDLIRLIEMQTAFDAIIEVAINDDDMRLADINYLSAFAAKKLKEYSV